MKKALLLFLFSCATAWAQEVTLEYRVKAAYIYNFVRFVDWPAGALGDGPLNICVAGRNPFGSALGEMVQGEDVDGRALVVRVILEPEPGCHVMFIPRGAAMSAYLRAIGSSPVLTIGETPEFAHDGGIITFVLEGGSVRFEINQEAATRARLQVSSRLLRLARPAVQRTAQ
jgi:hypothetical protein